MLIKRFTKGGDVQRLAEFGKYPREFFSSTLRDRDTITDFANRSEKWSGVGVVQNPLLIVEPFRFGSKRKVRSSSTQIDNLATVLGSVRHDDPREPEMPSGPPK